MTEGTVYTGTVVGNPSERVLNTLPMGRTVQQTFTVPLDGAGTPYTEHRWFVITMVYHKYPDDRTALETMTFSYAPDNQVFRLSEDQWPDLMVENAWKQRQRQPDSDPRSSLLFGDAVELNFTIIPRHLTPMSVGSDKGEVLLRPSDLANQINKDHPSND